MDVRILIGLVIRHIIGMAGGGLLVNGTITDGQIDMVAGAIMTLVAVAWSIWQKTKGAPNA